MLSSKLIGQGLAASAGAASGALAFTCDEAEEYKKNNVKCILCRMETSADDIGGLNAATGVITIRGGVTSHAAVIMRGMGKSAVTGASNMSIRTVPGAPAASTTTNSSTAKTIVNPVMELVGERPSGITAVFRKGDVVTIDGSSGKIYSGEVPTVIA
eukprot:gene41656-51549_t